MKYCTKAGVNQYFLTFEWLQEIKITVTQSTHGNIVLDCWFNTLDGYVAEVKFLPETVPKSAQLAKTFMQKDIVVQLAQLGRLPLLLVDLQVFTLQVFSNPMKTMS